MPVYMNATTSLRPTNRPRPSAAPSGTPMSVLKSSAMPDTRSESETISASAASPAKDQPQRLDSPFPFRYEGDSLRYVYLYHTDYTQRT